MNKIIEPTKRVMAFLIVFLITLSSFLPITTISVNAQDSDLEIKTFAARFVSGAGLEEGKYVWNANNTSEGHRFTYRISFTLYIVHTFWYRGDRRGKICYQNS